MQKRSAKGIAVLMMYLIVSMTFFSAAALASFSNATIQGEDGMPGVLSDSSDSIFAGINLASNITPELLKIDFPEIAQFTSCTGTPPSGSYCIFQGAEADFASGIHNYNIREYDSQSHIIGTYSGTVMVDGLPPVFSDVSFSTRGNNLSVSYTVEDFACEDCEGNCSGVSYITVSTSNNKSVEVDAHANSCRKTGSFMVPLEELSISDGMNGLCIKATDRVGHESPEYCITTAIDSAGPMLIPNSLIAKDEEGSTLTYVPVAKRKTTVSANFSDASLDLTKVYANFSSFPALGLLFQNEQGKCREAGNNNYVCLWEGIIIGDDGKNANSSSDYGVVFTATDSSGNTRTCDASLALSPDVSTPEILDVYVTTAEPEPSADEESDFLYLKRGENLIRIDFSESGSGFGKGEAYISLGSLSSPSEVKAKECYESGSGWTCKFNANIIGNDYDTGNLLVLKKSSDDAGNKLENLFIKKVIVDVTPPSVGDISLPNVCPYAGQNMEIVLTVTDSMPVIVTVTPRKITSDNETFIAECSDEESAEEKVCKLTISGLVGRHVREMLRINVSDYAMNTVIKNLDVEVCEAKTGSPEGSFSVSATPLHKVDLRALSFIDLPAVASLSIDIGSGAKFIESNIVCSPNTQSAHLIESESDSPTLTMKIKQSSNATMDKGTGVKVDCILTAVVKSGNYVYTEAESENFSITFSSYNNPLGTIDESIKQRIEAIDQDIKDTDEEIESWEKWNKWLSMLCTLAEMLATIDAILGVVKSIVYGVAYAACLPSPVWELTCPPATVVWNYVCRYINLYDKMIQKFVWPPGSSLTSFTQGTGAWIKSLCMIYSCKICSLDQSEGLADMTGVDGGVVDVAFGAASFFYGGTSVLGAAGAYAGAGAAGVSAAGSWLSEPKPNTLNYLIGGFTMDPYKSIHAATSCLCLPALIYNLKKQKQIQCKYKTCLQKTAKLGLPLETCDNTYAVQRCLYVDGAQWKLIGDDGLSFIGQLFSLIIRNLPMLLLGTIWQATCNFEVLDKAAAAKAQADAAADTEGAGTGTNTDPCSHPHNPFALTNVLCHLSGAVIMIAEIGEFSLNPDMDKYSGELEGETVC